MNHSNKRIICMLVTIGLILIIPLVAMQVTTDVDWGSFDFFLVSILLLSTGLTIKWVLCRVRNIEFRIALCVFIMIGIFLLWAELAVGVFETRFAGSL